MVMIVEIIWWYISKHLNYWEMSNVSYHYLLWMWCLLIICYILYLVVADIKEICLFLCNHLATLLNEPFNVLLDQLQDLVPTLFSWVSWFSGSIIMTQYFQGFFSISIYTFFPSCFFALDEIREQCWLVVGIQPFFFRF